MGIRGAKGGAFARGRARCPRAALVWGLVAFGALQLSLAAAIEEHWQPQLRDPEYGMKLRRLRHRTAANRAEPAIIMLGSSRTAWGFKTRCLDDYLTRKLAAPVRAFNFGILSAGPVTELIMLKRLLAEGYRPKLVLIEVLSPVLVDRDSYPFEVGWLTGTRLWLDELRTLRRLNSPTLPLVGLWSRTALLPWHSYRVPFLNWVAPEWLSELTKNRHRYYMFNRIDDGGWAPVFAECATPADLRRAREEAEQWADTLLRDFRLGPHAAGAVRQTLDVCRRHGIATALVLMPEGNAIRSRYPAPAWAQIHSFLEGLSREYRSPLINARAWSNDADFVDGHHLQPWGAERFSRRLGPEVLRAWRGSVSAQPVGPLARQTSVSPAGE
jgi:hypothetical protein